MNCNNTVDESKPLDGILARRKMIMIQENRHASIRSGYDSDDWD